MRKKRKYRRLKRDINNKKSNIMDNSGSLSCTNLFFFKKSTKGHKGIWYDDNMELEGAELLNFRFFSFWGMKRRNRRKRKNANGEFILPDGGGMQNEYR